MSTMRLSTDFSGDWRSGHYGADRLAHLFIWHPFNSDKSPACGARAKQSRYVRKATTATNACRECRIALGRDEDL